MSVSAENRTFKLHPDILYSIIQAQAGTLSKAFLELVMNSIDAGASKVDITLTGKKLSVTDDGKGFANRTEIEAFFETFGTPHTEGDATYGRFRMGRGQLMSFCQNRWRSGEFSMSVDIKNKGLNYDLVLLQTPVKGCSIEGDLYEPLKPSEVLGITDDVRNLCKYAPIPVFVNGERVSVDLANTKWTLEDDDAYYLIREKANAMDVYNLGVHVRSYSQSEFGLGGVCISKKQLQVNFARNDILASKCDVWRRVSAKLRAHAKKDQEKKPAQTEGYRKVSMEKILSANFDSTEEYIEALEKDKIFTDIVGKHYSLDKLRQTIYNFGGKIVSLQKSEMKADKVQQQGLALVLAPVSLERAKWMSFENILARVIGNLDIMKANEVDSNLLRRIDWKKDQIGRILEGLVSLESVASSINEKHTLIDEKELSKEEKLVLKTIRDNDWPFSRLADKFLEDEWGVRVTNKRKSDKRKILVCESETADAYTDGVSMIALNRRLLKIGGSSGHAFGAFDYIKSVMLHEYCHSADDSTGHEHNAEFYERFHNAMCSRELTSFSYHILKQYLNNRRKAGMPMRSGDLFAMDSLAVDFDENTVSNDVKVVDNVVNINPKASNAEQPAQLELAAFTRS